MWESHVSLRGKPDGYVPSEKELRDAMLDETGVYEDTEGLVAKAPPPPEGKAAQGKAAADGPRETWEAGLVAASTGQYQGSDKLGR